jgi:colanic acid/amylovoran biosynthesis glycosyltransferase
MHIGVIASMKSGLAHFIYREVSELASQGATISLFPTKQRPGLYNPRPEWKVYRWSAWRVILCQPLRFVRMPLRYLTVLVAAIRCGELIDFLIAAHFAPGMRNVDVIYATFGDRKLYIGYFAKLLLGKPLVVTIHSSEMYFNPNQKLFPIALNACDHIFSATDYNRYQLCDRYGIARERIDVIRLSIDLELYRPEAKFVILMVGFFGLTKGHEVLFRALKQLEHNVEVWVVGGHDGRPPVDVPALVRQIGVESQVAFFGKLSDVALRAVYHACDVVCVPCRHDQYGGREGFPSVLVEAMACGKPIVTTRHTEIPRVVEQIIVPENNVDALADALQHVYDSPPLRNELGIRNRELAEEHFSTSNVEQALDIFCSVAASTGGERASRQNAPVPLASPPLIARLDCIPKEKVL